jgi:hypothetical protein
MHEKANEGCSQQRHFCCCYWNFARIDCHVIAEQKVQWYSMLLQGKEMKDYCKIE